jgi:hypothetical protein
LTYPTTQELLRTAADIPWPAAAIPWALGMILRWAVAGIREINIHREVTTVLHTLPAPDATHAIGVLRGDVAPPENGHDHLGS